MAGVGAELGQVHNGYGACGVQYYVEIEVNVVQLAICATGRRQDVAQVPAEASVAGCRKEDSVPPVPDREILDCRGRRSSHAALGPELAP